MKHALRRYGARALAFAKPGGFWVSMGVITTAALQKFFSFDPGTTGYAIVSAIAFGIGPFIGFYLRLAELKLLENLGVLSNPHYQQLLARHIETRFPGGQPAGADPELPARRRSAGG